MFKVSVIIPVYNAAAYVENAVKSAVNLNEVGEILLVDDGFPDGALEICRGLESQYAPVRVLQHPNGENRGPGASRNLGISSAKCEFVAFLDADDWYLPQRFETAKTCFEADATIDGVYDATGFFIEKTGEMTSELTTLPRTITPERLFFTLVHGNSGYFHTNAITVRRSIFNKSGLFDEQMKLHQDTHLWLRFAFVGKLVAGNLESPVAVRRVHDENRISRKDKESLNLFYRKTFEWFRKQTNIEKSAFRIIWWRYISTLGNNRTTRLVHGVFWLALNPKTIMKLI